MKKGAGTARNTGIKRTVEDYLLFADADDWFMPNFFDSVKAGMANGAEFIYFAPTSKKWWFGIGQAHTLC